jgi:hypothetical protein
MGNIINSDPFEERKIAGVSEPINDYINRYLKTYGEETGSQNIVLWNTVYTSIDFNSPTFQKIKQMNPELQIALLSESFDNNIYAGSNYWNVGESLITLEYWNKKGTLDKLNKLYDENKELDYSRLRRGGNNGCISIGSNAITNYSGAGYNLIIPYKNDNTITVHISTL